MDLLAAATLASSSIELLKKLRDANASLKNAEHTAILADLINQVTDLKMALVDAKEEIVKIREEKKYIEEKLARKEEAIFEKNSLWFKKPAGEKDGPYCNGCYGKDSVLIRLKDNNHAWFQCPVCKEMYRVGHESEQRKNQIDSDVEDTYWK